MTRRDGPLDASTAGDRVAQRRSTGGYVRAAMPGPVVAGGAACHCASARIRTRGRSGRPGGCTHPSNRSDPRDDAVEPTARAGPGPSPGTWPAICGATYGELSADHWRACRWLSLIKARFDVPPSTTGTEAGGGNEGALAVFRWRRALTWSAHLTHADGTSRMC